LEEEMNTTDEAEELRTEIIKMIEELSKKLTDEEMQEIYNKIKKVVETGVLEQ
jgi:ribonuclease HIII